MNSLLFFSVPLIVDVTTLEDYSADNITVIVEWTQEGVSYNITVVPMVSIRFTGNTSVQFEVLYDIEYNVSFVTACRSIAANYIQLFYGKWSRHVFYQAINNNYSYLILQLIVDIF